MFSKPRLLYVLNGFHSGGAEHGLLTLLENNFFEPREVKIIAFCQGDTSMQAKITACIGEENIIICDTRPELSLYSCYLGAKSMWNILSVWQPHTMVLSLKQSNIVGRFIGIFNPKIKVISFEHSSKYKSSFATWFYISALWLLSWRVNGVWADCKATLESTNKYFIPKISRQKLVVTPFIINTKVIPKNNYNLHSPLKLVAVGRLSSRKRLHIAIESLAEVISSGINANLTLIGNGTEMKNLKILAKKLAISEHVHFTDYIPDWSATASKYDIFIHPSNNEGFAITVAEAMAAGLPSIAANIGGIKDYGHNQRNIWKVKEPTVKEFTIAILSLSQDKNLRQSLGEQAHSDILSQFNKIDGTALKQ